jgi:hypothetical protein
LSGIEKDLGPKGLAVLETAVNDNADIPGFIQQFKPPFPVGSAPAPAALQFIQWPPDQRPLVPFMVFIDRLGVIRAQYTGADASFFDDNMDQHIRGEIEKLLSEAPAKPKTTRKAQPRPAAAK